MNPTDPDPNESRVGLAPEQRDVPEPEFDVDNFRTYTTEGVEIKQVPLEVAEYWYFTQRARFVDTRVSDRYDQLRIDNAVHSPAPDGIEDGDDPLDEINPRDRIVTYCICPDALSSMRAANLLNGEYEGAYALGPGLEPWLEAGLPTAGSQEELETTIEDYSNIE